MAKSVKVALELDNKNFNKGIDQSKNKINSLGKEGGSAIGGLKKAFGLLAGAIAVKELITFGETATQVTNRLRGLGGSALETQASFDLVKQVALDTRSDLSAVADLFTNISVATADMGLNMNEVAGISETFSKTLKISGADAASSAGAIRQFGQALASGVLRGDEFNSIMEANPVFMRKVAEAVGRPIGELRELAAQGKLTSDILVAATQEMADDIDDNFGNTIPTISESFVNMKTTIVSAFQELEQNTGLFETLAKVVAIATDNLDILASILAGVFAAAAVGRIVAVVNAVIAFTKAMQAAAVAGTILQGVTGIGLLKVAAGLTAAGASIAIMNDMFGIQEEIILDDLLPAEENLEETRKKNANAHSERTAQELLNAQEIAKEKEKQAKQEEKIAEREEKRLAKEEERKAERHQKELLRANERFEQTRIQLENDLKLMEFEQEKIGMTEEAIEIATIQFELEKQREELLAEIAKYNISDEEKNVLMEKANQLINEQIGLQTAQATNTQQQQQNFIEGWRKAWDDYKKDAADTYTQIQNLGQTAFVGIENAFVDFVTTGKSNFKDLVDDMIKQLMRIVAKKIFVSIINMLAPGLGSVFEGFFDSGGYIGQNKIGIVGERGPEIVQGPARVIGRQQTESMLSGIGGMGGSVTYNISAVDARSFRELVAADPEFIYSVTQAGQRSLP